MAPLSKATAIMGAPPTSMSRFSRRQPPVTWMTALRDLSLGTSVGRGEPSPRRRMAGAPAPRDSRTQLLRVHARQHPDGIPRLCERHRPADGSQRGLGRALPPHPSPSGSRTSSGPWAPGGGSSEGCTRSGTVPGEGAHPETRLRLRRRPTGVQEQTREHSACAAEASPTARPSHARSPPPTCPVEAPKFATGGAGIKVNRRATPFSTAYPVGPCAVLAVWFLPEDAGQVRDEDISPEDADHGTPQQHARHRQPAPPHLVRGRRDGQRRQQSRDAQPQHRARTDRRGHSPTAGPRTSGPRQSTPWPNRCRRLPADAHPHLAPAPAHRATRGAAEPPPGRATAGRPPVEPARSAAGLSRGRVPPRARGRRAARRVAGPRPGPGG